MITASALVNGTFDKLIGYSKNVKDKRIVTGPSGQ